MERKTEVEILIHIDAPSRAVDDTRYRSLADSYLNFEPAGRVDFLTQLPSSLGSNHDTTCEPQGQRASQQDPVPVQSLLSSSLPLSELIGSLKSPQASFQSVLDNGESPRVVTRYAPEEESASNFEGETMLLTQSPGNSPSSVVQDSYQGEYATRIANLTSPTRVLEYYLQEFESTSPETTSQPSHNRASHGEPSPSLANSSSRDKITAPLVSSTPPIVPCTPPCNLSSTSAAQHGKNMENQLQVPQSQHDPSSDIIVEESMIESFSSNLSSHARADSEPLPDKLPQPTTADESPRTALQRSASDIGPRTSAAAEQTPAGLTVTFLPEHGYTYDTLELYAPEPPVSMAEIQPSDLITPGLARLDQDLVISRRYKPASQQRPLEPFERGHWRVDCTAWDPRLKRDAWAYLANYVGTGVAGWSIWCVRDPDFRRFRIFCWGVVVPHIYLLLYLASQRRVLYTGCSWVGAGGEVVVVMGTRS
ncbi:uncharacterized protein GGS25DRAFT_517420 [Hypoxylon fragiforme]|uniref:uncharacterized protein n=1 Tax=Hypoxylon fragiforme TaxID=63214 RepID=UPI0020C72178|nr:uncharacterized protein GGS25DRAFT_517420 [Hypoxylon fragiforme]KAI2614571.1 hypothetical protein GGS25DRAFT_517420 [Hypoxylon fragiforme]